jgi:alginate O-acetyltransferase complex protein AlgI
MVFASLIFLYIFLPLNLILYYVSKNASYRNIILTLFSFVFYAWGEPVWVLLLLGSCTVDWLNALYIEKHAGTRKAKIGIVSSVIFNIGLLMVFKYSGFLYENLNLMFGLNLEVPSFTLPIGISFYTFQSVSYVIDVYRGEVKAQKNLGKFMMFVSLYHQLVAGPIVRYQHIMTEIDTRKFNIKDISSGIHRFCIGLFKKVCIANVAAGFVTKYMDGSFEHLTTGEAWFGAIMFSVQIYFDFSGYSDMAIGLGKMFGFHYHENFNYPYMANSATDFWRRWHISLGTFFRDYIYIPMGGNKKWMVRNLFVVWFLTGLWHGASWNFIFWGLYFGILIYIERLVLMKVLNKVRPLAHAYLIFAAILGWVLFYFTDLNRLIEYLKIMFGQIPNAGWTLQLQLTLQENVWWLIIAFVLTFPVYRWANRKFKRLLATDNFSWAWMLSTGFNFALLLLSTAMLAGKSYNPFIYYRF